MRRAWRALRGDLRHDHGNGEFAPNTNYVLADRFGETCTLRIEIDGSPIPAASVRVRGIPQPFDGGTPCTGYQVLPRSRADFTPSSCNVAVERNTWSAVKTLFREDR